MCTYQQVDAPFFEAAQAFGEQDERKDLCLANLNVAHTLYSPKEGLVELPELGCSGRKIRICYLIRSVEAKEDRAWPWQLRQAAVYHWFDVETGRS